MEVRLQARRRIVRSGIFPEGNRTFARNVVDWSMKQTLTRGLVLD